MSLVRVTFTKDHGDHAAGDTIRVDPASAESLVNRGLASVEGPTPPSPPADEDQEESDEDSQDFGDPEIPLSHE